jgi:hypothetical protein
MHSDYISMTQAAKLTPSGVSPATVWRWARHGVKSGLRTIALRHIRVGCRVYTKQQWLDDFYAEVADADLAHRNRIIPPQAPPHEPHDAELREAGL